MGYRCRGELPAPAPEVALVPDDQPACPLLAAYHEVQPVSGDRARRYPAYPGVAGDHLDAVDVYRRAGRQYERRRARVHVEVDLHHPVRDESLGEVQLHGA